MSNAVAPPIERELESRLRAVTGRRVREMAVEVSTDTVTVSGRAESFHIKQLALAAIRDVLPTARVRNRIEVDRN